MRRFDPSTYNQVSGEPAHVILVYPSMNHQTPLDALWRTRLDAIVEVWAEMRGGDAKALHRVRVASRRIRESLPVIAADVDRTKLRKLSRKVREVTRLLGPVRALDVELGELAEIKRAMPSHRAAITLVGRHLAASRRALRKRTMGRVDEIDVKKLVRKLARVGAKRDSHSGRSVQSATAWRSVLGARTVRRAARLREAIEQAGSLYVPGRLHAVRIAIKKLRYILEVAEEAGIRRVSELIQALKDVQGTLGRLHDLQSLLEHGRNVHASIGTKRGRADLDGLVQSLERRCRRLHAEFVIRHEDLLSVCDRARNEVARQILPGRPRAVRVTAARSRQRAPAVVGQVAWAFRETHAAAAARSGGRHG